MKMEIDLQTIGGIIGSVTGSLALALHWKKLKKEEPKIVFYIVKSWYESKRKTKRWSDTSDLTFNILVLFENKGNAAGSITDIKMRIRYSGQILEKYPFMSDIITDYVESKRPKNFEEVIPLELGPYGSKKVELKFEFEEISEILLDRCLVSLDLRKPKKWEWKDLPLRSQLTVKCTTGFLTTDCCIFRKDLPESKTIRGSISVSEDADLDWNFLPELGEEQ